MYEQIEKSNENKSRVASHSVSQKKSTIKQREVFVDNRCEVSTQRKIPANNLLNSQPIQKKENNSLADNLNFAGTKKQYAYSQPAPFLPLQQTSIIQLKLAVKNLNGDTLSQPDKVEQICANIRELVLEKEAFFLSMEKESDVEIARQVYAKLKDNNDLLIKMIQSSADYGLIDLGENQHLALLYFHSKRQLIIDGVLNGQEDNGGKLAKGLHDDEALAEQAKKAISGKEDLPNHENAYPVAILGAGASAAYYLVTSGRSLSPEHTVIIGARQPWDEERGSEGVINHPLNMIAPLYQGEELADSSGGLAPRKKFSQLVSNILASWPNHSEEEITKVEKHQSGNYFTITTNGDTYYARKVVAALGIGKHKAPGKITWAEEDKEHVANKTGKHNNIPRMMDMDRFQRAIVGNEFAPDAIKSIAVIGPNAAIDVMSTVLRNYPKMSVNPIYWVTGTGENRNKDKIVKKPFFLKGTDNEYVESRYDDVVKEENRDPSALRIYKKGVITVVGHDYLSASVGSSGVDFIVGERPATRDDQAQEKKSLKADIVVYGLGPDVGGVSNILGVEEKQLSNKVEPIYDINQHFTQNTDLSSKQELQEYLSSLNYENSAILATQVEKILENISAPKRPGRESLSKVLPSVVGMRLKGGVDDKASMEVIGATAYRFAFQGRVGYDYVSKSLSRVQSEEFSKITEKIDEIQDKNSDFYSDALEFQQRVQRYLTVAIGFSKKLEAIREPDKGKELSYWIESTRGWLSLIKTRLEFAKNDDKTEQAYQGELKKMTGIYSLLVTNQGMLEEMYNHVETSKYGALASTHMSGVSNSLPKNVVLGDQLTASRSAVEALQSHVPPSVAKGVNFVTSDQTVIAARIAASFAKIPPQLADYITSRIVFERRHLTLDKAPLPRPELAGNRYSDFTLKQQNEFQQGWNEKLRQVALLF